MTQVDPNGLAAEHGLKTGDVILDVGGKKVATAAEVRDAIGDVQKDGKRAVLIRLKSNNVTKFVAIPVAGGGAMSNYADESRSTKRCRNRT